MGFKVCHHCLSCCWCVNWLSHPQISPPHPLPGSIRGKVGLNVLLFIYLYNIYLGEIGLQCPYTFQNDIMSINDTSEPSQL